MPQRGILKNIKKHLTSFQAYDIIDLSRGEKKNFSMILPPSQEIRNKNKKPLDKAKEKCYNNFSK